MTPVFGIFVTIDSIDLSIKQTFAMANALLEK